MSHRQTPQQGISLKVSPVCNGQLRKGLLREERAAVVYNVRVTKTAVLGQVAARVVGVFRLSVMTAALLVAW